MKKIFAAIMVCAFVLSFSGLTMAAEEKKTEAPAAAPSTPAPVPAATPASPAVAPAAPATAPAAPAAAPVTEAKPAKIQNADDIKWIAQCVLDNKDEGQPMDVLQKYCECMNDKMDVNETQSVTQWEKTHPKERKECSDKAGWK